MLDTATGYADGYNVGRHIYATSSIFSVTGTQSDVGETFFTRILPGENVMRIDSAFRLTGGPGTGSVLIGVETSTGYGTWSSLQYYEAFDVTTGGATLTAAFTGQITGSLGSAGLSRYRLALSASAGVTFRIQDLAITTGRNFAQL